LIAGRTFLRTQASRGRSRTQAPQLPATVQARRSPAVVGGDNGVLPGGRFRDRVQDRKEPAVPVKPAPDTPPVEFPKIIRGVSDGRSAVCFFMHWIHATSALFCLGRYTSPNSKVPSRGTALGSREASWSRRAGDMVGRLLSHRTVNRPGSCGRAGARTADLLNGFSVLLFSLGHGGPSRCNTTFSSRFFGNPLSGRASFFYLIFFSPSCSTIAPPSALLVGSAF